MVIRYCFYTVATAHAQGFVTTKTNIMQILRAVDGFLLGNIYLTFLEGVLGGGAPSVGSEQLLVCLSRLDNGRDQEPAINH